MMARGCMTRDMIVAAGVAAAKATSPCINLPTKPMQQGVIMILNLLSTF
jgi:hypothetical protein